MWTEFKARGGIGNSESAQGVVYNWIQNHVSCQVSKRKQNAFKTQSKRRLQTHRLPWPPNGWHCHWVRNLPFDKMPKHRSKTQHNCATVSPRCQNADPKRKLKKRGNKTVWFWPARFWAQNDLKRNTKTWAMPGRYDQKRCKTHPERTFKTRPTREPKTRVL